MYKRVLLKFSGEALKGNSNAIVDSNMMKGLASMIAQMKNEGTQVCIVIGAGNIWRGKIASDNGLDRVPADYMGMLGTVINAVTMSSVLKNINVPSLVTSAVPAIEGVTVTYSPEVADKAMNEGKVVFLAGGTGKPYFTTDTAATMRAIELNCDAILIGKNGVDGIYDDNPATNPNAKFISEITFNEIIKRNLQVMDISAIELVKDKDIDVRVFSMEDPTNFIRVAKGESLGTTCKKGE
ncbi:MAG: UMP kinase [Bacilli bacterium]|nr:UMP kinase [Bacilli bacterium]